MLRKLNCYVIKVGIFLITAALIAGMAGCGPLPPAQEIRDWHDLDAIRDNFSTGYSYLLMNDLDSTTAGYEELASPTANGGKGWQPIGTCDHWFDGLFYGQGHEIRDLFIDRPGEECVGLFGKFVWGGVQDIGVVNFTVAGSDYVGVLVGRNHGFVINSFCATGNVTGNSCVGGLVGYNSRDVVNSYYNCDEVLIGGQHVITVGALFDEDFEEWLANDKFLDINERLSQENGYYVVNNVTDLKELLAFGQNHALRFRLTNDLDLAGEPNFYIPYLAGEFDGNGHKISNLSFNFDFVSLVGLFGYLAPSGKITQVGVENINIAGYSAVGGLLGFNNEGTVSNSHSSGNVTGEECVGGLVGRTYQDAVTDSYFTGSVAGEECVGGLVGQNEYGNVSNSYSTGNVTGVDSVGGLVGHIYDTNVRPGAVTDSYSSSNVTGSGAVGGLVGRNREGTVSNSYSTGSVTGDEYVGGLVGYNDGGYYVGPVNNSFWDTQTSGQATSDGGIGKTTAEMQDIATFSGADWNITAVANPGTRNPSYIWNIVDDVTYPFLSWQP